MYPQGGDEGGHGERGRHARRLAVELAQQPHLLPGPHPGACRQVAQQRGEQQVLVPLLRKHLLMPRGACFWAYRVLRLHLREKESNEI